MGFTFKAKLTAPRQRFVPPGAYRLRVIKAVDAISKKSGNEMIELTLVVIHENESEGPLLNDWLVNSDASAGKNTEFVKACGKPIDENGDFDLDADNVIGWELKARLGIKKFNEKESNEILAYIQPEPAF